MKECFDKRISRKEIIFLLILIARSSLRVTGLIPQHQMVSACVLRLWGMQIDVTPERGSLIAETAGTQRMKI